MARRRSWRRAARRRRARPEPDRPRLPVGASGRACTRADRRAEPDGPGGHAASIGGRASGAARLRSGPRAPRSNRAGRSGGGDSPSPGRRGGARLPARAPALPRMPASSNARTESSRPRSIPGTPPGRAAPAPHPGGRRRRATRERRGRGLVLVVDEEHGLARLGVAEGHAAGKAGARVGDAKHTATCRERLRREVEERGERPPVQRSVGSEGQPLIAPLASMPRVTLPAPHEPPWPRRLWPRSSVSYGPK